MTRATYHQSAHDTAAAAVKRLTACLFFARTCDRAQHSGVQPSTAHQVKGSDQLCVCALVCLYQPCRIIAVVRSEFLTDATFTPENAKRASPAAEGLCKWVHAMSSYDKVRLACV